MFLVNKRVNSQQGNVAIVCCWPLSLNAPHSWEASFSGWSCWFSRIYRTQLTRTDSTEKKKRRLQTAVCLGFFWISCKKRKKSAAKTAWIEILYLIAWLRRRLHNKLHCMWPKIWDRMISPFMLTDRWVLLKDWAALVNFFTVGFSSGMKKHRNVYCVGLFLLFNDKITPADSP